MAHNESKKKNGNRKHGRNRVKCEVYRKARRREKHKVARIKKYNGAAGLALFKEREYAALLGE